MKKDFYVDEEEFVIAANTIFGMANYYVATLERYIDIMTAVKNESIRDNDICNEIMDIIATARKYQNSIQLMGEEFRKIVLDEIKAVEENETYSFPTEPDLASIFAM